MLRDKDERSNQERVRREVLVKEKAEYINELCKRGREPGFGEDLSECRIGMVRSWHSRSGIKESGLKTSRMESGTKRSKVLDSAMKGSKRF